MFHRRSRLNSDMDPTKPEVEAFIRWLAPQFGLNVETQLRQCQAESGFNQAAISPCNAIGLMQLLPDTAKDLGVDPKKWRENVTGGLRYMKQLRARYAGDYARALAGYNWGMGHLDKCLTVHGERWRDFLPTETKNYLNKIL